jgi:hypothetical protein
MQRMNYKSWRYVRVRHAENELSNVAQFLTDVYRIKKVL